MAAKDGHAVTDYFQSAIVQQDEAIGPVKIAAKICGGDDTCR